MSEELQERARRDMKALEVYLQDRCPKSGSEVWFWNGKLI